MWMTTATAPGGATLFGVSTGSTGNWPTSTPRRWPPPSGTCNARTWALRTPPSRADQLRASFEAAEADVRDALFEAWQRRPDGERMGSDYLALFIQLNRAMAEAMQAQEGDPGSEAERSS